MLINLTNHPSKLWSMKQIEESNFTYGTIHDLNFPDVDPNKDEEYIKYLSNEYLLKCKEIMLGRTKENNAILVMGEMTFCFNLINKLQENMMKCISTTSSRIVTDLSNNQKMSKFNFIRYREYL